MKRLLLLVSAAFCLAACNKEIAVDYGCQDKILVFDLSLGASNSSSASDMTETKAMTIQSADGSVSLPLEYRVAEGIVGTPMATGLQTKGTQYNSDTQVQTFGFFNVTAWNSDHSRFIPDSTSSTADADSVKYNATAGWTLSGGTNPVWKSADVKTFFAYTNLPAGSSVSCSSPTSHTFSYPALNTDADDQDDALLGYYKGNGDSNADGKSDGVASIKFIHPLTAVVFQQGTFTGVTAIKSISIEGVFDGGTADVTYLYDANGHLVPSFDWGSSLSDTTTVSQSITGNLPGENNQIGKSFIIFPQNLTSNPVTVKVVVTTTSAGDHTLQAELSSGVWEEGKTNIYTIGGDANNYTYTFTYDDGTTQAKHVFTNTVNDSTATSGIISKKVDAFGNESVCNWIIESVQVGTGLVESIEDVEFDGRENLTVTQASLANLSVMAAGRQPVNSGSHDYWVNQNPTRTDYLDWSPDDWSSTHATEGAPLDLSTFNFQTETFNNPMTTANCYVIRHAGTYKLPLVYGNAVKNGNENTESYFPNVTSGTRRLDRFINYAGNGILSPFIENDNDVDRYSKCAILWQDKAVVVTDLRIVGNTSPQGSYNTNNVRYLQFDVDPETICQNNAVICIYKDLDRDGDYDEGEAIWSWHIWTTNDPDLLAGPIPVTNYDDTEYDFFPLCNLGWRDPVNYPEREDVSIILRQEESDKRIKLVVRQREVPGQSNGCYYEFGRKDPMCPESTPASGSFNHAAKLDAAGNVDRSTRLHDAISHPATFYITENQATIIAQEHLGNTNYYTNGWIDYQYFYNNLWTGKYSSIPGSMIGKNSNLIKTIYDPSPAGYMVPAPKAYSGFSTDGLAPDDRTEYNVEGDYANGWYMYTCKSSSITALTPTIYFPAAGYHAHHDSSKPIRSVGTYADYWTSTLSNNYRGYRLFFRHEPRAGGVIAMGMGFSGGGDCTGYGMAVRPVQE